MYYISSVQRDLFCLPWDEVQPLISSPPPFSPSSRPSPANLDDITRPEGGITKLRSCSHFSSNRYSVMPSFHLLFIVALVVVLTFYEHTCSHYSSLRFTSRIHGCGFVSIINDLLFTCYIIHATSLTHHWGWHSPTTQSYTNTTDPRPLYLILREYNPNSYLRGLGWVIWYPFFAIPFCSSFPSCSPTFPSFMTRLPPLVDSHRSYSSSWPQKMLTSQNEKYNNTHGNLPCLFHVASRCRCKKFSKMNI